MQKQGNKVRLTVSVSTETGKLIEELAARFNTTASAVVEVCVSHESESLKRIDRFLGPDGFDQLCKFLRWWTAQPSAFEKRLDKLVEEK